MSTVRTGWLVAAAAVVAWLPSVGARFIADDFTMLRTAESATGPLWPFAHNDLGHGTGHFYRPLWVLLHSGLVSLFGRSPLPFHLVNLLLFAALAMEVWLLAGRVLAPRGALVAALAFALYPRHGESVAWVSGSTDLLSVAIGLAALLVLTGRGSERRRLAGAASLAVAAALAKEAGFVLPALALLLLMMRPPDVRPPLRDAVRAALVLAAPLLGVLVVRALVLSGLGGYGQDTLRPGHVLGAAFSYLIATLCPPQLLVLRHPAFLLVPLALLVLGVVAVRWHRERRVALGGLGWYAVALLPVLGLPLDLNNSSGERLLLLPSVGLALAVGSLAPVRPSRRQVAALTGAAAVMGALCLDSARNWIPAGRIADRVADAALRLAPERGQLILVSYPDSYRNAHVLTNGLDDAVRLRGRRHTRVDWCVPVALRREQRGAVRFRIAGPAVLTGIATRDAPFDFPVLRDRPAPGAYCAYDAVGPKDPAPGQRVKTLVRFYAVRPPFRVAYFDGRDLRPFPVPGRSH